MGVFTTSDTMQRKPHAAHQQWAVRPLQGKSATTIRWTPTKTLGDRERKIKREKERKTVNMYVMADAVDASDAVFRWTPFPCCSYTCTP